MKSELNRHVRKIGNPIVYRHPDGRLWLFFVTVSVGGWAGSSISLAESADNGETWSRARRLVTSPFFNLSTLVKGSAFRYADGTIGLPVYHEFLGKFGEMLRIGSDGRILDKTRFTSGRHALQPEIAVPSARRRAVGMLRYAGDAPRRVLYMVSDGRRPDLVATAEDPPAESGLRRSTCMALGERPAARGDQRHRGSPLAAGRWAFPTTSARTGARSRCSSSSRTRAT